MKEKKEITQLLQEYFVRKSEVIMAFLFGSFSKGKSCQESDIDIGVYLTPEAGETQMWCEIERLLKKEVDLIVLNHTFPVVAWEALRGIPLTIKDRRIYIDFLLNISREAEDLVNFNIDTWRMKEETKCAD